MTDCSTLRLPATTNREPNEATMRNHGERATWVAAPPATARSVKPAATQASSMIGVRFSTRE